MTLESLNYIFGLGTVGLQLLTAAFLVLFFLRKKFTDLESIAKFLGDWGLWIGFLLSAVSVVLTLYYSDVLGILPCGWCWFQRVALYPQVFLFAIALWKCRTPARMNRSDGSDVLRQVKKDIADYSIALSIFGLIVALYMHYLQMGGHGVLPCPATGAGDCGQRFMFEFGYITFPLMAASLFAFLIVLMLFVRKSHR